MQLCNIWDELSWKCKAQWCFSIVLIGSEKIFWHHVIFNLKTWLKNILTLLCKVKSITQERQSNAAVMIIYYLTTCFKMNYCCYGIRLQEKPPRLLELFSKTTALAYFDGRTILQTPHFLYPAFHLVLVLHAPCQNKGDGKGLFQFRIFCPRISLVVHHIILPQLLNRDRARMLKWLNFTSFLSKWSEAM